MTTEPMTTSDTGMMDDSCDGIETITLEVDDADLSGGWFSDFAVFLNKDVARYDVGGGDDNNGAVWTPEIPCEDEWRVWVQFFDEGDEDDFDLRVDGEPNPEWARFDGDCGFIDFEYKWRQINWRMDGESCNDNVNDPWVQTWGIGPHELRFKYRSSETIATVVVTNDPDYNP